MPPDAGRSQLVDDFSSRLLAWWDAHGRKDLPWQSSRSPYRVWISEIMLQQTQVATVVPYFERFIGRFPEVATLATAELDEVLHLWSGLGYYARARNLHRTANVVVVDHGGNLPTTEAELGALPGIGPSTAAAIVAQAYGRRAPILDGNAKRVLARQHRIAGPASSRSTEQSMWQWAERHTPADRAADYTQAIMDLGATVCRRSRPRCGACPVRTTCRGYALGDAERFPERSKPRPRRLERRRFFVLLAPDGRRFVEQRPATGIWGGLWSPPERPADESLESFLAVAGIDQRLVADTRSEPTFRHAFSHFDLDVEPVYVLLNALPLESRDGGGRWIEPGDHALGVSTVAARLMQRGPWTVADTPAGTP